MREEDTIAHEEKHILSVRELKKSGKDINTTLLKKKEATVERGVSRA